MYNTSIYIYAHIHLSLSLSRFAFMLVYQSSESESKGSRLVRCLAPLWAQALHASGFGFQPVLGKELHLIYRGLQHRYHTPGSVPTRHVHLCDVDVS